MFLLDTPVWKRCILFPLMSSRWFLFEIQVRKKNMVSRRNPLLHFQGKSVRCVLRNASQAWNCTQITNWWSSPLCTEIFKFTERRSMFADVMLMFVTVAVRVPREQTAGAEADAGTNDVPLLEPGRRRQGTVNRGTGTKHLRESGHTMVPERRIKGCRERDTEKKPLENGWVERKGTGNWPKLALGDWSRNMSSSPATRDFGSLSFGDPLLNLWCVPHSPPLAGRFGNIPKFLHK